MNAHHAQEVSVLTLGQVAELVQGEVVGNAEIVVAGVAPIDEAGERELGLLASPKYGGRAPESGAAALLVADAVRDRIPDGFSAVVVRDAHVALATLLGHLHPIRPDRTGVHSTAVLGPNVSLGEDVYVAPYAVIGADVTLGDRCRVEAHCVVGDGCRIGNDTVLHPHVVLYPGTEVGRDVVLHAGVKLGVDGFGYVFVDGQHRKVPQVGGCAVNDGVEIGANSCVDRGSIGRTTIGAGTKLDNLVHLAHNVHVGKAALIVAQVGIAGSTRVGDGAVFGGQAGAINHLDIGAGARIAAQAGVIGDVAAGETVMGFPARPRREFLRTQASLNKIAALWPELKRRRTTGDADA